LAVTPAEADAVAVPYEPGLIAFVPHVPERMLAALLIVIDAPSDQPPCGS
jgi:hypothetical protein